MRRLLLATLLIAILNAACTNIELSDNESVSQEHESDLRYLAVFISSPSVSFPMGRSEGDWEFEYGSESESQVNTIRFYFFDDNGTSVNVNQDNTDSYVNYIDWSPSDDGSSQSTSGDENVELNYKAVLALDVDVNSLPSYVVAIINPPQSISNLRNPNLSVLQNMAADFITDLTDHNFVMTNSVYVTSNSSNSRGEVVCPVKIEEDNITNSEKEALLNQVSIYVERVVARLDLSIAMDANQGVYETGVSFPEENTTNPIFVKFLGWTVSSTPKTSNLLKSVDKDWDFKSFFNSTNSWNDENLHRSFWAMNPEEVNGPEQYFWYTFNDISGENGHRNSKCHSMSVSTEYLAENANPYGDEFSNPTYPTNVLIAAQLVYENGEPAEIAEYNSRYFTPEGLKNYVIDGLDMWFENGKEDNGEKYSSISPEDLTWKTVKEIIGENNFGPGTSDNYYIYFSLSNQGSQKEWYHKIPEGEENNKERYLINNPENYIREMLFPAKIWTKGYTYYFFNIPHNQETDSPGSLGVVRNHFYDASIVGVTNLGTPVFEPRDVIYPEKPKAEINDIKVIVKTMKWRLLKQNLQLSW